MHFVRHALTDVLISLAIMTSGADALMAQTSTPVNPLGGGRLSLKINALELLCTIPNIGAEYDLTDSPYNRLTLSLTAKYNPDTWHTLAPVTVFNLLEFRSECRWWYRQKESPVKFFSNGAFYAGGYLHGGSFSVKMSPTGRQGILFGIGASYGYDFPLYTFKKFCIDFELGASLGFAVSRYELYRMNNTDTDFVILPDDSMRWRMIPYPILSELRASFAFRTLSIKDKYKKDDPERVARRRERAAAKEAARVAAIEKKKEKEEAAQ